MELKKRILLILILWAVFIAVASGMIQGYGSNGRVPVLIDTDMGLDDVRALYALLGSTSLDIEGVVTVEGSSSLGSGTDNLISLLESTGMMGIPIFQGASAPGLQSPPWRETANNMGGCTFPPPREIEALQDPFSKLKQLLLSHGQKLHYLALGPLRNLAMLESRYPGTLQHIHTIWIPACFSRKEKLKDWNLVWDKDSTKRVFSKARRIVLIDLDSSGVVNGSDLFSSAKGASPAGRWIERMLLQAGGKMQHIRVYDELAAAALIKPDLMKQCEGSWSVGAFEENGILLKSDSRGNIHVAAFQGREGAVQVLKECWSRALQSPEHHDHEHGTTSPREYLKAFHGHLGPYVVLGYRMGRLALEQTGTQGHFDISAEIYSVLKPPQSCLIDGIQLGSGCTLGKRNIEVHSTGDPAYAIFKVKGGQRILIRLRPKIPGLVTTLVEEKGVEQAGEFFLDKDLASLFEVDLKKK